MLRFVFLAALAVLVSSKSLKLDLGDLPMQNPDLFGGDMLGVDVTDRIVVAQPHRRWIGKKVPYVIDPAIMNLGDLPMQNPDLFGGDMLGVNIRARNVIPGQQFRWTGKKVPYVIDPSVSGYTALIQQSMENYHQTTCVRFVPRTNETNFIRIFAGQGCYSNVGMIGGQQPVSLGQGCMFKGTIVHELGHALGFFHEQNRSDRDQYLTIYWQNIQSGMESQFALLKPHENLLLAPFDYNSIMIYGNTAFSKDGRSKTMVAKNGVPLYDTYSKPGLSQSDIISVNKMYRC